MPIVSIITPFLDAERFIGATIQSVLAQTMPAWELLLIDDGSKDASSAIARRHASQYPDRIRYFEHEGHANRGKSVSRNLGVARARGDYLTFLDADDVFLPHKLEHQLDLLVRHPQAVMVYGSTEYWVSWDAERADGSRDWPGKLGVAPDHLYYPPQLVTAFLRDPGIVPCICGLIARTSVARAAGSFDERIQDLYEDQVFLVKMLMAGPVYVESGHGERYRQHSGSSSALAVASGSFHPTRSHSSRQVFLEWVERYLATVACADQDVRRALRAALAPYRHPTLHRLAGPFGPWLDRLLAR